MARQLFDISTKLRLKYVHDAVEELGRGGVQDIWKRVAAKMNVSNSDPSTKRTIYRDLKTLADAGEIGVDQFLPNGTKIETVEDEDSTKNTRVEYFSLKRKTAILGERLLHNLNGEFFVPDRALVEWRIQELANGLPVNTFCILLPNQQGSWIVLSVSLACRPLSLVIARESDTTKASDHYAELTAKYGRRISLLALDHASISRFIPQARSGHLKIDLESDGTHVQIQDLGSTSGTRASPLPSQTLKNLIDTQSSSKTLSTNSLDMSGTAAVTISTTPTALPTPSLLHLGPYCLLVSVNAKG